MAAWAEHMRQNHTNPYVGFVLTQRVFEPHDECFTRFEQARVRHMTQPGCQINGARLCEHDLDEKEAISKCLFWSEKIYVHELGISVYHTKSNLACE